ncbi:MAG: hypothetical protein ACPGQS_14975 [Bradymonadia bacterium]
MSQSLVGVWLAESKMTQPEMTISSTGEKRFVNRAVVEDHITTAITMTRFATAPLILSVRLTSEWQLKANDTQLCERLTLFDVAVVSKPPAEIMPPLLVAEVLEQTQRELQQKLESKRASCNAIRIISPHAFTTKDSRSGQLIRFVRRR